MRILFVEDDQAFRTELADYLRSHGLQVETFDHFGALAKALDKREPSLVLLDLTVGSEHGIGFLRDVLRADAWPVVVLSGSQDETDRIISLELGADDFILKTVRPREILARIRAVMRRSAAGVAKPETKPEPSPGWRFLPHQRDLIRPDGSFVRLTTAEFNLLHALIRNQGRPVGREALFAEVFGRDFNPLDRAIDNLVAKLRHKLGDPAKQPTMIRTVRPFGYLFTGFSPTAKPGTER